MSDDEPEEWHELDQASTRKSVRDIMRRQMPDDYGDRLPALRRFMDIVHEELIGAVKGGVNAFIELSPKATPQEARALVEELDRDLSILRLALQHPQTGEPSRLTVAASPPPSPQQGWLQIEPVDRQHSRTPTVRLPRIVPPLDLMMEPGHQPSTTRYRGP